MISAGLLLAAITPAAVSGCGPSLRDTPVPGEGPPPAGEEPIGVPPSDRQRSDAYRAVIAALPATLRQRIPTLRPLICLDRGITSKPDGPYVAGHDDKWLQRMLDESRVAATGNRNSSSCPDESWWLTLALPDLLPGDSLAVPLTLQPVVHRPGPRLDRTTWTAVLASGRGQWTLAYWKR